jgi:hypothetical protein
MTQHVDVAAYLLGALDEPEMAAFEAHLAECELCGTELDELSKVLPVLDELRQDGGLAFVEPPGGDAMLQRLLRQVSGERRARKRRRLVAVAAAAVLVIVGPTAALLATGDGGGPPVASPTSSALAAEQHSATNTATGASATVGLSDTGWGSSVDLRLSGIRGPLTCSLVAVGQDGSRQTVATWSVPDTGYGTDSQPVPLTVHGAAGLHKDAISRFDVRTTDGALLVSVPV